MQLLEAMFYQSPMLVSDIPVLHEVAGDTAFYTDTAPGAIAQNITSLLRNDGERTSKAAAGTQRLQDFSWKKVAHEVYEQIRITIKQ